MCYKFIQQVAAHVQSKTANQLHLFDYVVDCCTACCMLLLLLWDSVECRLRCINDFIWSTVLSDNNLAKTFPTEVRDWHILSFSISYPNTIDCAHVSNLAVWKLWLLAGAFTVARVRVAVTTAATPKLSTVNNILLRWVLFVMLIFATHDLRAMYYYHTKPPIFQVWLD